MPSLSRRALLVRGSTLSALLAAPVVLRAQALLKVKFQLDWRFDGQTAPFFLAQSKGYFAQEGLDVQFDVGTGSGMAITRVSSGTYEMGYGDMNALIEVYGVGADMPTRPQAIYQTLESTPAAAMVLSKSGIAKPADLVGKTLAAPVFDAGRKLWPLFAAAQGLPVDAVKWMSVEPALRELMLIKGQVDGVTGFQPSGVISAVNAGAKEEDLKVFHYKDYGVNVYGNAVVASTRFISEQPAAVAGFLRAYNKGLKDTIANPDDGVRAVRQREPLINVPVETRRLTGQLDQFVTTPNARAKGLGEIDMVRLQKQIDDFGKVFSMKAPPKAEQLFNPSFLPAKRDRMLS